MKCIHPCKYTHAYIYVCKYVGIMYTDVSWYFNAVYYGILMQCINTFSKMITKIQKDESLRYILTWLSDLLMDEEMLLYFSYNIEL